MTELMKNALTKNVLTLLVHDVAKYLSRTAHNVDDTIPEALTDMFLRDVYGRAGEKSASERFAKLDPGAPELEDVRARFQTIDQAEEQARARDPETLAALLVHVRAIDLALRTLSESR